ncbi:uncharacterized protein [Epargyreus clarus]|uniref:uncharacterized protein n=1 Tax=Epargyreus clarus TaxID=520877 RepID=UPI003C2C1719
MPADDVSDLRDVVDAINRLCETMKTSEYECAREADPATEPVDDVVSEVELVNPAEVVVNEVETYVAELWSDASSNLIEEVTVASEPSPPLAEVVETVVVDSSLVRDEVKITVASDRPLSRIENVVSVPSSRPLTQVSSIETVAFGTYVSDVENVEKQPSNQLVTQIDNIESVPSNRIATRIENVETSYKSVTQVENVESVASDPSPTKIEDIRTAVSDPENLTSCEPVSEMYYTASSEVSLLSDFELPERVPQEESVGDRDTLTRDERNGVIAGHVAAMRERFESMTRTNTPCPDLARSVSPSLDVYRNITPSPDHLG